MSLYYYKTVVSFTPSGLPPTTGSGRRVWGAEWLPAQPALGGCWSAASEL